MKQEGWSSPGGLVGAAGVPGPTPGQAGRQRHAKHGRHAGRAPQPAPAAAGQRHQHSGDTRGSPHGSPTLGRTKAATTAR